MFKFFNKTKNTEVWVLGRGSQNGKPMFLRINKGLRKYIGDKDYPHRMGIAIPFLNPNDDGLPDQLEGSYFDKIEDSLFEQFSIDNRGLVAMIITTNGFREFVIYVKDFNPEEMIKNLKNKYPDYDFQYYVNRDPDWEFYKSNVK